MPERCRRHWQMAFWLALMVGIACAGCQAPQHFTKGPPLDSSIARELVKVAQPEYTIEPPDILQIDAIRIVPIPPYRIEPLDSLLIHCTGVDPNHPIQSEYGVMPEGTVNLGIPYGNVRVAGLTIDEAKAAIEKHLKAYGLQNPIANISLSESRGKQQIRGEHLVRPDGTVNLGTYGSVFITGMTIAEAKSAVEKHLSQYLLAPEVAIDVLAFNSKVFYVITDGGGLGATIARLPITGNETVLDVLSQTGLPTQSSKRNIWIARPAPAHSGPDQILPVDYNAIVRCGQTATNYQLMPGDRLYLQANPLITVTNWVNTILAPIERVFGVTLLGQETIQSLQNPGNFLGSGLLGSGATRGFGGFGF